MRAPFSAMFNWGDKYLMSASPERFLKKKGNKIISQPMKGTAPRSANPAEDSEYRERLRTSEKDRAENVMIVDLVRNDLARSCKPGSVQVDELFGIYTFPQVHQMVSVVSGELQNDMHPVDVIKHAFPMGSMTGAPKVMAMRLIEEMEESRRGMYAGSIGYFTPDMDFDFNVVIRSILYNDTTKYISIHSGGAIVFDSDPEEEYKECLIKVKGLRDIFELWRDKAE
jgi:para-aminobenzoate synthetase component 1